MLAALEATIADEELAAITVGGERYDEVRGRVAAARTVWAKQAIEVQRSQKLSDCRVKGIRSARVSGAHLHHPKAVI